MDTASLVLLPWRDARRFFGEQAFTLTVVAPPYPATGEGELRVLRVRSTDGGRLHIACGFERYTRA
jgi:hypothetical protein